MSKDELESDMMMDCNDRSDMDRDRNLAGFTLIELLVVIAILGILAAVVVFSVSGVGNKGDQSACKVDERTMRTAEAAFFSSVREDRGKGGFGEEKQLFPDFLSEESTLHDIAVTGPSVATPTVYSKFDVTVSPKGAESCIPDGAVASDCLPETTLPIAGTKVKVCTRPGGSAPVKYPF